MTTINFTPSATSSFQFNPTLDGQPYVATCTWNIYGQRYYVNIYNSYSTLIMSRPIIASPDNYDINLLTGYFTSSTMVYRASSNDFIITP
jgi:hypothetical protein